MRCSRGHENPDDQRFCGQCGEALQPVSTEGSSDETISSPRDAAGSGGAESLSQEQERSPGSAELPERRRRWRSPVVIAAGLGVVVVVVIAVLVLSGGGEEREIKGSFVLFAPDDVTGDMEDCRGTGGYDDFGPGMDVTVKNEDGKTIGNGSTRNAAPEVLAERLALGENFDDRAEAEEFVDSGSGAICVVLFEAPVEDAKFYEIEVGRRGGITHSKADLEDQQWYVSLTLGV